MRADSAGGAGQRHRHAERIGEHRPPHRVSKLPAAGARVDQADRRQSRIRVVLATPILDDASPGHGPQKVFATTRASCLQQPVDTTVLHAAYRHPIGHRRSTVMITVTSGRATTQMFRDQAQVHQDDPPGPALLTRPTSRPPLSGNISHPNWYPKHPMSAPASARPPGDRSSRASDGSGQSSVACRQIDHRHAHRRHRHYSGEVVASAEREATTSPE
jgi:hypothetical protein